MLLWKTNKNKPIYYLGKKIIYLGKKNDHAGYLLKYEIHCTCITIATIVLIQSKQRN